LSSDIPLWTATRPDFVSNHTSVGFDRSASAEPNTFAVSARVSSEWRPPVDESIEPDKSTRINVSPGSSGTFASDACSARSSACAHRSDRVAR
jgi:hypothetical protein